jgi:hypothetical protein
MTDGRLYGRRRIVEFVKQALERDGVPIRPLPVMRLAGPRGSGGSAVVDRLWDEFSEKCLSVRLDLKDAQGIEDIALAATQGWGRRILGIRAIGFPRIGMVLKALSFVDDGGGRAAFEAYLRAKPQVAVASSALNAWAARAAPLLPPAQQFLLAAAAGLLGRLLTAIDRRRDSVALSWLVGGTSGGGSGYDRLWDLYCRHHGRTGGPEAVRTVGKTVCAALLADLRSDFNDSRWFLHGQRPANCLLLLDNADSTMGDLFLDLLAESRRESNSAGARPDPAMVVAVQRRSEIHSADALPPVESTDERLEFTTRHPAAGDGDDHPAWWYPVRLTDLGGDDVVEMCRSSVLGKESRDAGFLHALTGGHPEATDRLAHLLARFGREPYDPRRLLDERLPRTEDLPDHWPPDRGGPTTVEDYLLKRILADDLTLGPDGAIDLDGNPMVDAMAVLAVTPGLRRGACNATLQFLGWTQFDADTAQRRLLAGMWLDETPEGDAARLHPLAGLLLRRWLARKPQAWRDAHQGYAAHYSRPQDASVRHHHTLALLEPSRREPLATVVGYLEREFDRCASPEDWLQVLDDVVSAPNRLRTTADPRTFVTSLAGAAEARDRHQIITRLTVARWLYHDRHADPSHRLAQLIANEYDHLAECTDDNEVLFRQSGKYRRIESNWKV